VQTFTETLTGIVPASDTGLQCAAGVTYVDVPFTSKDFAFAVTGNMTNPSGLGVDMDLQLLDSAGRVLSSSATDTPNETVTAAIQPNQQYRYRVIGWAGAAQDFSIVSTQSLLVPKAGGGGGSGSGGAIAPSTGTVTKLLRFTFNPVTGTITIQPVG